MEQFGIRTDLALETQERFKEDNVEVKGVRIEKEKREKEEVEITKVFIDTPNGAKIMGKPKGTYVTLEAAHLTEPEESYHKEISKILAEEVYQLLPKRKKDFSVLFVGLGNRDVTPDSLGPRVLEQVLVTRHIIKEYGRVALGEDHVPEVSGITPGVMAQTGMETVEIIRGVVEETKPDFIIVIDALAARSTKRLNRTIQITDTGINPGAGVGNHRNGIHEKSIGVPVIAVGVPTVVDAATIVHDTMENFVAALGEAAELKNLDTAWGSFQEEEKRELIKELIAPHLNGMFVTPKDVDETIRRLSLTISEGLNLALEIS